MYAEIPHKINKKKFERLQLQLYSIHATTILACWINWQM